MNDVKPWYASKGVWGSVLAIVLPGLALANKQLGWLPADQDEIATLIANFGGVVAGVIALYGRITATAVIGAKS